MKDYMKKYRKGCKQKSLHDVNGKHDVNTLADTDTDTDTDTNTNTNVASHLATFLLDLISERNPKFKKPLLKSWIKDIDLMIRIDKRDPVQIRQVIQLCQKDPFWQNNILSGFKLRKQYDQLAMKLKPHHLKGKVSDTTIENLDNLKEWMKEGDNEK
jgi:hypothetical protein